MRGGINGGHYMPIDPGAVGATGLREADVAADVMRRVAGYLRSVNIDILEIQANELYQITNASNAYSADFFVSIHCNAATNTSAKGTETYCFALGGEGERLARCIQNQIVTSLGTVDRGIKTANFQVLRETNCPAVLVEMAFISNPDDEALLSDLGKRDEFAKAIARGITDYLMS